MAKDFKASQVRTTQIIASGSTAGKPSLVILSASSPGVNFDGSGISSVPSAVGRDVFLFVSGSTASKNTTVQGVTLFGGDIMISGTAYGTAGAFAVVAGSDTQVQFNDGGTALGGDSGLTYNKTTDTLTVGGDLAVNGGDLTSTQTTFNLLNSTVTTLNVGGAATAVSIGNSAGTVTVPGNLTVNGTTTTVNTTNLVVKDPLIYFGSSSLGGSFNNNGGIALASGSAQANEALVWGRVALNTWGAGKKDVTAGTTTDLTNMTLVPIRSSKFELGGVADTVNNASFISSSLSTNIIISSTSTQITGTLSQGNNAQASGDYSHAQGGSTLATGIASHAEGDGTISSGFSSHSEGISTTASGEGSHAEGANTTAEGDYSHSEGYKTLASAQYTHAEGYYTTASWAYSHAEGWNTIANALYSHTEGQDTIVDGAGNAGHAEGTNTRVTGDSAHAEGNRTLASGIASHAEGYFTTASGQSSHAQGYYSITEGNYSFAGGQYTIASGAYQTVLGQYNKRNNSTSLFVVGNGTGDANSDRSDIFLIDSNTIRIGSGSNLGTDTFLFVSGAIGSKDSATKGVTVLGGDVVISGTLYGGSPLKIGNSTGLSGSLYIQTQNSAPDVGTNESVLYVLDDGGTKKLYWKNSDGTQQQVGTGGGGSTSGTFNEVNSGGTISLVTTASVSLAGTKGFNYGVNQVGVDTFFFVSGSTSSRGNSSGEVAVFGGHTVFSGALFGGVNPDLGRTLLRQEASQIAFSKEEGLAAGSVTGTDVFMFVSGAIESKNTTIRGATVFGGDAVISGNLHGGSRDLQITSNTIVTGTLAVTGNLKLYTDVILGNAGSSAQITREGDTSKFGFPSDGTIQLDTSNAPGAGIVKFAKNATQYLVISQTNTAGNLASIAMLKAGNSEGIIGFTSLTGNDLSAAGADTFFYVSGSTGSRGTSTRGTAVFGGDIVVSGNIRASEIELGSASAFVSSSNGSSLEIGAATQVLIMSGGGATSKDPRSLLDTNFFVSGTAGAKDTSTRGSAVFGGDLMVSGQIFFGGDTTLPSSVSRILNSGQIAYWQNWYPTNPVINLAAKFGAALSQFQVSTAQQNISGRLRIGNLSDTGTAYLHITRSFGAANTAPIKLQSGTLLSAPEDGAIEFNGTSFFVTSGSTRQTILTTFANNTAVTSSFHVSTGSNLTLRVPGAAGDTARSIIMTTDRTPTPTTGSDAFIFISGSTSSKGTSTRGTAVFGGDVVISGTLHGGVQFGSSTGLTVQANKVQVTSTTLSFGQSGGSDVGFFVSGSPGSRGIANTGGISLFGGDVYMSGSTYLGTVSEYMTLTQSLNSIQTFNMSSGSIFHSKALAGDITANFTNVPTHEGRAVSANLIVSQSITAYIVSAIQIGGASQTLLWANGVTPTGNPGKHDVFGFSLIRSGSSWTVLGQMSTYG